MPDAPELPIRAEEAFREELLRRTANNKGWELTEKCRRFQSDLKLLTPDIKDQPLYLIHTFWSDDCHGGFDGALKAALDGIDAIQRAVVIVNREREARERREAEIDKLVEIEVLVRGQGCWEIHSGGLITRFWFGYYANGTDEALNVAVDYYLEQ